MTINSIFFIGTWKVSLNYFYYKRSEISIEHYHNINLKLQWYAYSMGGVFTCILFLEV